MEQPIGDLAGPASDPVQPGSDSTRSAGARARAGWLATTLVLAAALVVSSFLNLRAARDAVMTLHLGQAEIHSRALRSAGLGGGREATPEVLQAVLDSQAEAGLRYIGIVESDGSISASVGETRGEDLRLPPMRVQSPIVGLILMADGEGRVRALVPRPPDRIVGGSTRNTRYRFTRGSGLRFYLIEFDPVPASNVVSQAVRGMILSGVGAAILALVAVGFWRVSRDYEAAQKQIESQRRLSQLGEMSAVLAHEIRNPLASLKGNAQLLAASLDGDARMMRRAERVVGEAIRLEMLTTDLLDFARAAPVARKLVSPADLLRATADEVAPGLIEIDTSGSPDVWPLDANKLRQALANLIRNARQISGEGRPPIASVAVEDDCLVFTIRDFGPGIQPSDREKIFEPFFTTRTHGTGLGLPVAKRVAELHGGSIRADSPPDGGAIFRISLPQTAI